jgi:glutaminase
VLTKVGMEPSGEAFNSISLDPKTGRPLPPMINAGAIATARLVPGATPAERQAKLLGLFSEFAGRELAIDDAIYRSGRDTGHRNRAIAHLLRNSDILTGKPEEPLDLYFRQC